MHTLFLLSALLFAAAVGGIGAGLLRLVPPGGARPLALAVLAAPPFVLGLAVLHLFPRFWATCAPLAGWDAVASFGLVAMLGGVALGAIVLSLARLVLVERLLGCAPAADPALRARAAALADRLGLPQPALGLLRTDAPLAVTGGLRRPTIVLSTWLVERLDGAELEAVFAHELAHLRSRDHLVRWAARLLRDMTVYLPSGWYALRALEAEQELAADARAVEATARPLAMASALGKVWAGALSPARPIGLAGLPAYAGSSAALLEERLNRLLDGRARATRPLTGRLIATAAAVSVGEMAPRALTVGATALPLMCSVRW